MTRPNPHAAPTDARLIAFAGLKEAGKDSAAEVFVRAGYRPLKFADGLKRMLRALIEWQDTTAPSHRMTDGDLREVPSALLGGRTPRHAMQTLGTEWGRELMASNLWVEAARRAIEGTLAEGRGVVISDLRFDNEATLVQRLGGVVVLIERPGLSADDHASESGVQDLPVNWLFDNDAASFDAFQTKVQRHLLPAMDNWVGSRR